MRLNFRIHLKPDTHVHKRHQTTSTSTSYILWLHFVGSHQVPSRVSGPSRQRKILMNIQDLHNGGAKSLCWDWRFEVPKECWRGKKKNVIHKEWKGCHSKIRPLSPSSVCLSRCLILSLTLCLSLMMWRRSEILKKHLKHDHFSLILFFPGPLFMSLADAINYVIMCRCLIQGLTDESNTHEATSNSQTTRREHDVSTYFELTAFRHA